MDASGGKHEKLFSDLAEHLMKIALFPSHCDQSKWRKLVFDRLVTLAEESRSREKKMGQPEAHLAGGFNTSREITNRIDEEVSDQFNVVMIKMARSVGQRDDSVGDFNSISDLGYQIEAYWDASSGLNLRIKRGDELIADTMKGFLK